MRSHRAVPHAVGQLPCVVRAGQRRHASRTSHGCMDPRLALTDLWCRAIEAHEALPLTRSAALAAHAVEHEDQRRREAGIPSIFEPPFRARPASSR